jgi:hypothetical protein
MRTFTGLARALHTSRARGIFEHVFDICDQIHGDIRMMTEPPDAPISHASVCSSPLASVEFHADFDADFEAHFDALIDDAPPYDVGPDDTHPRETLDVESHLPNSPGVHSNVPGSHSCASHGGASHCLSSRDVDGHNSNARQGGASLTTRMQSSVSAQDHLDAISSLDVGPIAMAQLAAIDVGSLTGSEAIAYLQIHDRIASWWAAHQVPALVRAAGTDRHVDSVVLYDNVLGFDAQGSVTIVDAVREEIAAAMRWSPSTAQHRIDSARLLAGPLVETQRAFALGSVTPQHVEIIVTAAQRFEGAWSTNNAEREFFNQHCQALESRVLPTAVRSTVARTRQAAARSLHAVDPVGTARRRRQALHQRDVFVVDEHDGVSLLLARMSTEHAHACLSALNSIVQVPRCDSVQTRPTFGASAASIQSIGIPAIGVRRSEALAELILASSVGRAPGFASSQTAKDHGSAEAGAADLPGSAGMAGMAGSPSPIAATSIRAHVDLVIDLATLLALRDGAAELHGAGPIPPEVVRELLADATMRRIIADPLTGHQLDYGRRVYAVPQRLREFVIARDRTCRFPGCGRRASTCQIDHAQAWSDGGETSPGNVGALCTRHHQLKTHGGWDVEVSEPTGACTWRSPQGRSYSREAPEVLQPLSLPPSTAPPGLASL